MPNMVNGMDYLLGSQTVETPLWPQIIDTDNLKWTVLNQRRIELEMAVNDIANTQQFIVCNRKVWPQKIQFDFFFFCTS